MSTNSNEIVILENKRANNPNGNIEELKRGQNVKALKEKIEIMLYIDLYPNIYKTLRKEGKKLDKEYRATPDKARKLALMAEHEKIKAKFTVVRNNIQTFCEEVYRLKNAALFVLPSGDERDFYEKMMDIVKKYTKLFVPLDSEIKEDKENQIIIQASNIKGDKESQIIIKENVRDEAQDKQHESFRDRLAALNINTQTSLAPQPIVAMQLAFHQQGKNASENKSGVLINDKSMQPSKPTGC